MFRTGCRRTILNTSKLGTSPCLQRLVYVVNEISRLIGWLAALDSARNASESRSMHRFGCGLNQGNASHCLCNQGVYPQGAIPPPFFCLLPSLPSPILSHSQHAGPTGFTLFTGPSISPCFPLPFLFFLPFSSLQFPFIPFASPSLPLRSRPRHSPQKFRSRPLKRNQGVWRVLL